MCKRLSTSLLAYSDMFSNLQYEPGVLKHVRQYVPVPLKMRYFINTHKLLTPFFILLSMLYYNNFSIGPVVYLALHGTYCLNWGIKELVFPDKSFEMEISLFNFFLGFFGISCYWLTPYIVISKKTDPNNMTIFLALFMNILGTFIHFCSDAQKYFVLMEKKKLIVDGFYRRSRNTNFLGEMLTYLSFAVMAEHYLSYLVLLALTLFAFIPGMLRKEKSLSRYENFKEYKQSADFFIPKFSIGPLAFL